MRKSPDPGSTAATAVPTTTKSVTVKPTTDTRERILAAAITEFAAHGYSGGRIETIARNAASNVRMIYHHFGDKETLYVMVLEHVLGKLREDELQFDVTDVEPLEGIVRIFEFIDSHFSLHPETLSLLSSENLNRARFLNRSTRIPEMATPVIDLVAKLLRRGGRSGTFRKGINALHLYIMMVSLAYFHKSNAFTLSRIFQHDLLDPKWQREHNAQSRTMLINFLTTKPLD